MKHFPFLNLAKRSSTLGMGYLSSFETWLTVYCELEVPTDMNTGLITLENSYNRSSPFCNVDWAPGFLPPAAA